MSLRQHPVNTPRCWSLTAVSAAASLFLAACGGGGSSAQEPAPAPASDLGTLSVEVTDGPNAELTNVWVTVKEVWVHQLDTADHTSDKWRKHTLPSPVAIDLNQLSNGALSGVLGSLKLPAGTYKQIRLVLAGTGDALTAAAQAKGLTYNDQVNYTDKNGAAQVAPLELAQASQGIALLGNFVITAGGTLHLAVEFNVGEDIRRFKHGSMDAFTMTPALRYYDLSQSGAIVGRIDTGACKALAANPCKDFVIKAEELSADGTFHRDVRWTMAKADGSFKLFPVPAVAGKTYDLMIRGRNAQTMVVRGVSVTAGTTPSSNPTIVSVAPLQVQPATEFKVNLSTAANPTGLAAQFYQTVGGGVPYEMRFHGLNPFTGQFTDDLALVSGAVLTGTYVAGGTPALSATTPSEGLGGYKVVLSGWGIARADAGVVTAPAVGGTAQITTPTLQPAAKVVFGSISGTIAQTTAGKYDKGYVVVMRGGAIVNAASIDAALQANGGTGSSYTIDHLPAGTASQPLGKNGNGAGIYYAYLRVWKAGKESTTTKVVPIPGIANLDATNKATLNVTLP